MKHTHRNYTRFGFLLAAFGVLLGAFGSHVLKELIGESELNTFDTGVRYQMIHALAIIVISLSHRKFDERKLELALGLFIVGIFIFSGSLYLLATRSVWGNDSFRIIGAVTPLGGIAFIFGWLLLFFKGFAKDEQKGETAGIDTEKGDGRTRHRHRSRSHRDNSSQSEE